MVALARLNAQGGFGWQGLVQDYLIMLEKDPERYERVLEANRGEGRQSSR